MIKQKPAEDLPAIGTIEEAVALLRRTPASTMLCVFIGGGPFWLAMLYFLGDMGRNVYAEEHLAGAALLLAVLYVWKKCWQSVFASRLYDLVASVEPQPWTFSRIVRLVITQAGIQLVGLVVRPVAYVLTLPGAWISAYYQNATVLGEAPPGETE